VSGVSGSVTGVGTKIPSSTFVSLSDSPLSEPSFTTSMETFLKKKVMSPVAPLLPKPKFKWQSSIETPDLNIFS
jgi:hypothetical protein